MNKRGIQLSVNFIVMMILAIAVFSMGIYMVQKFFKTAYDVKETMDSQTEHNLMNILDDGSKVAVPETTVKAEDGFAKFGVGIMNVIGNSETFDVVVTATKAYDHKGDDYSSFDVATVNSKITSGSGTSASGVHLIKETVKNNDKSTFLIGVQELSQPSGGTYVFNLCVCDQGRGGCGDTCPPTSGLSRTYDNTVHKLYVKVEG